MLSSKAFLIFWGKKSSCFFLLPPREAQCLRLLLASLHCVIVIYIAHTVVNSWRWKLWGMYLTRIYSFYLSLSPQPLLQHPVHSRYSVNICWVSKWALLLLPAWNTAAVILSTSDKSLVLGAWLGFPDKQTWVSYIVDRFFTIWAIAVLDETNRTNRAFIDACKGRFILRTGSHVCQLKKKMHDLKVESYVLFVRQNWGLKPGTQHLNCSERLLLKRQGCGGSINMRFCSKGQEVGTSKDYC